MTRQSHFLRRSEIPFGSATLANVLRVGAGTTTILEAMDVGRDEVKTFAFRGDQRGSWFIDVAPIGTTAFYKYAEGTFPGGGTIKFASFTEAVRAARVRIRYSVAGSVNVHYGGFHPPRR